MYYILVIKNASKLDVMESCTRAMEYEQVKTEVHCAYESKWSAVSDAKDFIERTPESICEIWKMKTINMGTYSLLDWDKKVWKR